MRGVMLLLVLAIVCHLSAAPLRVEIFTVSTRPVSVNVSSNIVVDYYNVDDAQRLLAALNQSLNVATAHARWASVQPLLQHAIKGLMLLNQYDITAIPAIVINQEAIVEGQPDLALALSELAVWHSK